LFSKNLQITYKYSLYLRSDERSYGKDCFLIQGTDAVRLTGVSEAISQQIAKYDSSEFDDDKVRLLMKTDEDSDEKVVFVLSILRSGWLM
jgi:hypothetical protein